MEDLLGFAVAWPPGGSPSKSLLSGAWALSLPWSPPLTFFLCYSHPFYRAFLPMRAPIITLFLFLFSFLFFFFFFFFFSSFRLVPSRGSGAAVVLAGRPCLARAESAPVEETGRRDRRGMRRAAAGATPMALRAREPALRL